MTPIDPEDIRLFRWADDLPAAFWDDLAALPPALAAENCGALWRDGRFLLSMLGRVYAIDPGGRAISQVDNPARRLGYQTGLALLMALTKGQGVPLAGRMITPQELPGGSLFFTGPHALPTPGIEQAFGQQPHLLAPAAQALGGQALDLADASARIPALPQLDLFLLLWAGDEEFPAKATMGIDAHALYQLPLDAIWALCNICVARLAEAGRELS